VNKINITEEIVEYQSTLINIPHGKYNDIVSLIPKQLSGKRICYITLNKTYESLIEIFENENVDMNSIVFIDAITKSVNKVENTNNCYFISSPQALTELSIAIDAFLTLNFDYIILDSITTLLIYQKAEEPVIRFLTNIVNKIKKYNCKGIFYILDIKEHSLLIEESSMLMDKIIDTWD